MTRRDPRRDLQFDSRAAWLAKTGRLPPWTPDWQRLTPPELIQHAGADRPERTPR